jgi:chemotaxis protein CheC
MIMTESTQNDLSQDEKEILEELMNIAFGSASADLGEVIDIRVGLNVPEVQVADINAVPDLLEMISDDRQEIHIIEQNFWGDFSGRSFLAFSGDAGNALVSMADKNPVSKEESFNTGIRYSGVLLETGNILIGACIGKISELLETIVTYSPPIMVGQKQDFTALLEDFCEPDMKAIIIKTVFSFDDQSTSGALLTITKPESITWMKEALANFMENYA